MRGSRRYSSLVSQIVVMGIAASVVLLFLVITMLILVHSFDFREREVGSSLVNCAVCLENFRGGDECRLLPICKHSFHMECVDEWLLAKAHCPICRGSANSTEMTGNPIGSGSQTDGIAGVNGTESGLEDGEVNLRLAHELNRNQSVLVIECH